MRTVYLAGPITGDGRDWEWRDIAIANLKPWNLEGVSPLRDKAAGTVTDGGFAVQGKPPDVKRDIGEVREAAGVLAHFPYLPSRQSVGTFCEIGSAIALGKPVVVVSGEGQLLNHPFVKTFCQTAANVVDGCGLLASLIKAQRPKSVLLEAESLVNGPRNDSYGPPGADYAKTAKIWSGVLLPKLREDITPAEAMLCMIAVKMSREVHRHKRDNLVDIAGYAECIEQAAQAAEGE